MSRREEPDLGRHESTRLVLPWLVSGTLDAVEAAEAERHLADCPACRAELDEERRLRACVRESVAVAPAPHPVQLARLWERIDGNRSMPAALPAPEPALRPGRSRSALATGWRWLVAGQAAAIVVLGAHALSTLTPAAPATYRTLAATPAVSVAASAPRRLRVVFDDGLDQRRLRELLLPLGAEIVAGPSPLGVYTLALSGAHGEEPLAWVVSHLRAQPEVRFVEPLAAPPASHDER